jgi:hypothetical protein
MELRRYFGALPRLVLWAAIAPVVGSQAVTGPGVTVTLNDSRRPAASVPRTGSMTWSCISRTSRTWSTRSGPARR